MAGNQNSGRRPGGKDFAPRARSVIDRVIAKLEANGDADRLLEAAFIDDFVGTLQKVAPYAPKVIDLDVTTKSVEEYVQWKAKERLESESAPAPRLIQ
jgi:hypothetical protein